MNNVNRSCVICGESIPRRNFHLGRTCGNRNCRADYYAYIQRRHPVCSVCGEKCDQPHRLTVRDTDVVICSNIECRRYTAVPQTSRCVICGIYLDTHGNNRITCNEQICQTLHSRRIKEDNIEKLRQQWDELVATAHQIHDPPEGTVLTVIPKLERDLEPLAQERSGLLREHLIDAVHRSQSLNQIQALNTVGISHAAALTRAACSACQGYCCRHGANHGYLDPQSVRRLWGDHSHLSEAELIETIISFLPENTVSGSCIFHGETGCGLPEQWRSDTCVKHFCWGLRHAIEEVRTQDDVQVLLAITSNGEFVGSQLVPVRERVSKQLNDQPIH